MRTWMTGLSCIPLALACVLTPAQASDRGAVLEELEGLQRACRRAEERGRRRLYVVRVPSFRLGRYQADEGRLPVDTRQNLRAFDGAAELFPADLSPIAFEVSADRAAGLRRAVGRGAYLRLGFFLGFDEAGGTLCLVRSSFGVTTARIDVAFAEIVDRRGRLLARESTDRLRAWLDDLERDRVPGRGPRGVLRAPSFSSRPGEPPGAWRRALEGTRGGPLTEAIGRCHARSTEKGGPGQGRVVVRVAVDASRGEPRDAEVELSTVPTEEGECVARALVEHLRLPPAPELGRAPVALSVPVQLAD
ncbi:MAG: hypothetical protein ACOCV4_08805 [Myxococcota bacterium]